MVKTSLLVLALLAAAGETLAQPVDWRRAGGGLFAGAPTHESPDPPRADASSEAARLAPLDQPFLEAIAAAAERHGLDPKLLHALVVVESGYRPSACSPAGACGLAQLMPATAAELGVRDRFDPIESLAGGAAYLARQMIRFGDLRLALAAYNAGPGRVARLGRIPEIAETQAYVAGVVDCYLALAVGRSVRSLHDCRAGRVA